MGMFLEESELAFRPRVLEIRLGADSDGRGQARGALVAWEAEDPLLDAVGCMAGSALALSISVLDKRSERQPAALLVSVGCAVRRGLATASRATLAGIAPLTNTYVESQVGGEFALHLAKVTDALVLRGSLGQGECFVLIIAENGDLRLEKHPELASLGLPERGAWLRRKHPRARGLCVGSAGQKQTSFASFATVEDPPSFSGRGGLGARFGATGLCAVLVEGDEEHETTGSPELIESLAESVHLRARGISGTFELSDAFAARGDLPLEANSRSAMAERLVQRQACPGCPTACRHVLAVGERRVAGRFSATFPLGAQLGLPGAEDGLELLIACNAVGVDAAEMGACLAIMVEARPELRGNVSALRAEILEVASGPCARGAQALAESLGLHEHMVTVRGSAARRVSDLAAVLGQCVSARGNDPMRAFPFLAENGGDFNRLAQLLAPLPLPRRSFDSKDPAGKGRLVWWHENLANVIDVSGFCSFSFAGLVGDGLASLDEMSLLLAIPGLKPGGEAMLAAGACLALLQRELGDGQALEHPEWSRADLLLPGMWDEYRLLRGLDAEGRVTEEALGKLGDLELARHGQAELPLLASADLPTVEPGECSPGQVALNPGSMLVEQMGPSGRFDGDFPCTLGSLLRTLANSYPAARGFLWQKGESSISVYRGGERVGLDELVRNGDTLDLVVAISGG